MQTIRHEVLERYFAGTLHQEPPWSFLMVGAAGFLPWLAPLLIGSCKFCPSCSDYFIQAVREWGPLRGSWLGIRRLCRCHPFARGGLDPVPRRTPAKSVPPPRG